MLAPGADGSTLVSRHPTRALGRCVDPLCSLPGTLRASGDHHDFYPSDQISCQHASVEYFHLPLVVAGPFDLIYLVYLLNFQCTCF